MITKELMEAATEINVILDNLSRDVLVKIPEDIREFFKNNSSTSYAFEYDETKTLNEQELKPETKGIIAFLYKEYICDESEKQEFAEVYEKFLDKKEQEKIEFDPTELFNLPKNKTRYEEIAPVVHENNKWHIKFLKFIKSIFSK